MTVDQILIALRRAAEIGYPWSVSPHEAAALVAEVERLRAWAEEAAAAENANADDALRERGAVVAWLRDYAAPSHSDADNLAVLAPGAATVGRLALAIERGEHRREEEK